jgi:hypothetical protein
MFLADLLALFYAVIYEGTKIQTENSNNKLGMFP